MTTILKRRFSYCISSYCIINVIKVQFIAGVLYQTAFNMRNLLSKLTECVHALSIATFLILQLFKAL